MLEKLPDVLGHALRDQRAGIENITFHAVERSSSEVPLDVHSMAFAHNGPLPVRYTADGEGTSPPVSWVGMPEAAQSLVMIVEDADSPTPLPLVHAIVVGIERNETQLRQGALESPEHEGDGHVTGRNSFLQASWLPPDPPPGHGVHRYAFQLFALATAPEFSDTPGRDELRTALDGNVLARGCLIGTYERSPAITVPLDDASAVAN